MLEGQQFAHRWHFRRFDPRNRIYFSAEFRRTSFGSARTWTHKIGFVNSLDENISLLRTRATDPNLRMLKCQVGERNKKNLVISYVEGIADPNLVNEVKRRIGSIKIDDPLDSGYIEQLIEDNFMSPFPQVQSTERPDRVVASLLEGRVAKK
ncbi:spore germination protein [Paenibacillus aceris]|uniref:Uncharacterized protein n=1 Tax=Paenibacillus aceris TaxID=869555 RepID=A0ABS4I5C2_9BACL|nr:hypothetical protein [Paenibacillus aceris]NHW39652.1 spore germination protein [Paenibacillus aceris]